MPPTPSRATSTPELVDISSKGTASQSSLSRWSTPDGAQAAVAGDFSRDFTIHTDKTADLPWWSLDLGAWYPVEAVVVRNRKDPRYWGLAKSLRIEASEDGETWTLLHRGFAYFGAEDSNALTIPLAGQLPMRFLRISLEEKEYLHLNRVEVLVPTSVARDRALMEATGISFSKLTRYSRGGIKPETYRVRGASHIPDARVSGLRVVRSGRFANNVFQMARALQVATKYDLDFVQMIDSEHFDFTRPSQKEGPRVVASGVPLAAGSTIIEGDFFYTDRIKVGLDRAPSTASIARTRLGPYLNIPVLPLTPPADELVVHVRSGDLFGEMPHPMYGQPPLAFYVSAIDHARSVGFNRVRVVAEDRLNPVVEALDRYLNSNGVPVTMQIGEDLGTDLATLLAARGLVFGVGTFGLAICMLSSRAELVIEASGRDSYSRAFPHLSVVSMRLTEDYGPFQRWDNSVAQASEMLSYPLGGIEIVGTTQKR